MQSFINTFTEPREGVSVPVAELYSLWQAYGDKPMTAGEFKKAAKAAGLRVAFTKRADGTRFQAYQDVQIDEEALAAQAAKAREGKHPLAKCESCPLKHRPYVATEPAAEGNGFMFVGEAPGYDEARYGRPFVGRSGQLLRTLVERTGHPELMGAGATNLVACHPGDGKVPKEAVACCAPRFAAETKGTKVFIALGGEPAKHLTGSREGITEQRQRGMVKRDDGRTVLPTFHPAYTLRSPRYQSQLQADLNRAVKPMKQWVEPRIHVPRDEQHAVTMLENMRSRTGILAIDIETADAPIVPGKQLGVLITKPKRLRCIGLTDVEDDVLVLGEDALRSPTVKLVLNQVLCERELLAHNGKFDLQVLEHLGYGPLKLAADTMLAGYALDESKGGKSLEAMSMQYLDSPRWKNMLENPDGDDWTYDNVPQEVLYDYNGKDVANTYRLWKVIEPMLQAQGLVEVHALLCRASDMLGRAESAGLRLDESYHAEALRNLERARGEALEALQRAVGSADFNPGSHVQVKDALEPYLGYRPQSTDKRALLRLQREGKALEIVDPLLEFRKVDKLLGTYIGPLRAMTYKGKVHSNFNLIRTDTGRLSSNDPNFQNIPKAMRGLFIPDPGMVFVDTDIAQAELRVVAVESGDEGLAEVFRSGADVHGEVAEQLYGANYTPEQRRNAKTVVFGIAYGRTAYGIAADPTLNMDEGEAQQLIDAYYARFPRVRDWQQHIRNQVRRGEALRTKFGRLYRVPPKGTVMDKYQRGEIERAAMSFVPQSTASDICLLAACILSEAGAGIRALVHDAIVIECPEDEAEYWAEKTREALLLAGQEYTDLVPFVSDTEITRRWGAKE